MNTAMIYRVRSRWLIWVALSCAVVIHLAAIAIAENKSRPLTQVSGTEISDVIGIDNVDQPPSQPEEVSPSEPVPPVADDYEFTDENVAPRPIRPRKKTPVAPFVRSSGIGTGRAMSSGLAKALALYAPRPSYPYEARRGGITGSGIAELTVNSEVGNVIDVRMAQSTGSPVLDYATIEGLRRWRFKPGVASSVRVPITFTLTGVSY